jgi:hypothetical protein
MTDINELEKHRRWRVSLHEADHVIVGVVLAKRAHEPSDRAGAALLCGGGLAYIGGHTDVGEPAFDLDGAVLAAAGEAGERLASRYRPPRLKTPPAPITPDAPPTGMSAKTLALFEADHATATRDSDAVRAFCTRGRNGALWSKRWRAVHREAWRIVRDHRREVRAVARRLFADAVILPSEVRAIMPPPPALEDEL